MNTNSTLTITFGDRAENHAGMQMIGNKLDKGLSKEDLERIKNYFESKKVECEFINLKHNQDTPDAYFLIVRDPFEDVEKYWEELIELKYDKMAKMRGKVVNKHARWNLCFADFNQEPVYEDGKGRVVDFKYLPYLNGLRKFLSEELELPELVAEANYYFDVKKCGIGYHGDSERKITVGFRLGASMPIRYAWYKKSERINEPVEFMLNNGDLYFMEDKATGNDWKKSSIYTLRHAAGCDKYVK